MSDWNVNLEHFCKVGYKSGKQAHLIFEHRELNTERGSHRCGRAEGTKKDCWSNQCQYLWKWQLLTGLGKKREGNGLSNLPAQGKDFGWADSSRRLSGNGGSSGPSQCWVEDLGEGDVGRGSSTLPHLYFSDIPLVPPLAEYNWSQLSKEGDCPCITELNTER